MKVAQGLAQGVKVAKFITAVENKLKQSHPDCYVYQRDKVTVIAIEQFFVRISSNLLTFVILHAVEASACEIELISGGGAYSEFGITWGSESRANQNLIDVLHETAVDTGIEIRFVPDSSTKTQPSVG